MADDRPNKHPYVPAPGGLAKVISHFRKSLPKAVSADTLRKLGYAPKNESYVLNVLRFLELIDEQGQPTSAASQVFSQHDDKAFQKAFTEIVEKAYSDLFDLHKAGTWKLEQQALIAFFRSSDHTSALVGKLQASTFQYLAGFAGHSEAPEPKPRLATSPRRSEAKPERKLNEKSVKPGIATNGKTADDPEDGAANGSKVGLTVRIEINLPADGDQATYDRIFKSIRDNLLNA